MDATLRTKLLWLIASRAAVVTLLLGSAILAQIRAPGSLPVDPFFFVIALTYALSVIYSLLLKQAVAHRWLVDAQLACDALIVTAIVQMTGGVVSYFASLYALPIIAASTVGSRRGGYLLGVFSSLIYAGVVLGQYLPDAPGVLAQAGTSLPPVNEAVFSVGLNVFAFLAVARLSGSLAESLRRADARLQHATEQIADLQAFSQHVIDSLASGLATTDVHGRLITFNKAAELITGTPAPGIVGQSIAHVLQWPDTLRALFNTGGLPSPLPRVEFGFSRADGRQIDLGLSTAILQRPGGENGFVFTFRDVTDARREDRASRVQQRLAAVGEMAAGIAHEIRNPLASMSGSIQILRQELTLSDEQAQLMDIVIRESDRLNQTIQSFLAYARPQRRSAVRVDLRQTVTDTATLLRNSPERQPSHTLAVRVPADPVSCLADQDQIRQVVWNLATNGLRAMPDGGRLGLTVSTSDDAVAGAQVVIEVADDGVGIGAQDLDGIMEPFRGGFVNGTGLGLSIVHRIVTDYGGHVHVASRPGQGTTVTVSLPAAPAAVPAAAAS